MGANGNAPGIGRKRRGRNAKGRIEMKKIFSLLTALAMALCLCSCAENQQPDFDDDFEIISESGDAPVTLPEDGGETDGTAADIPEAGKEDAAPEALSDPEPQEPAGVSAAPEFPAFPADPEAEPVSEEAAGLIGHAVNTSYFLEVLYNGEHYMLYEPITGKDSAEFDAIMQSAEFIGNSMDNEPVNTEISADGEVPAGNDWYPVNDLESNAIPDGTPLYLVGDCIIGVPPEPFIYLDCFYVDEDGVTKNNPDYLYGWLFRNCRGVHLHPGEQISRSDGASTVLGSFDSVNTKQCAEWIGSLDLVPITAEEYYESIPDGGYSYTFTCMESGYAFIYSSGFVTSQAGIYKAKNPSEPPLQFPNSADVLAGCTQPYPHIHNAESVRIARVDLKTDIRTDIPAQSEAVFGPGSVQEVLDWFNGLELIPYTDDGRYAQLSLGECYEISYPRSVHLPMKYYETGLLISTDGSQFIAQNPTTPPGF